MKKIRLNTFYANINTVFTFIIILAFPVLVSVMNSFLRNSKHYSFFIEFNSAYGISKGTPVRLRGINIGHIQNIKIQVNSVLTLAKINSSSIYIPKNSIIETNQTGLLNETIIDIIPLDPIYKIQELNLDPLSRTCNNYNIICNSMYMEGDRGLNYDDLIRATTRISQRFDDPSFFNLLYIFLQNSIEISDNALEVTMSLSELISLAYICLQKFFFRSHY
uniref:Mce/MlaD domain-containing protein n=1 Tax=Sporolithon durum TaxID=48970 RepID=A0A141SCX8_9FLOR|nr:hypothetical protein Sdur_094 [Sporolithon durum]AMK96146.1 hypothetical protein Sdur_094 [Sporolithon durum]